MKFSLDSGDSVGVVQAVDHAVGECRLKALLIFVSAGQVGGDQCGKAFGTRCADRDSYGVDGGSVI